jgi:hypothetical protein
MNKYGYIIFLSILIISFSAKAEDKNTTEDFPMLGGIEFEYACSVCHGFSGKGNGVMADSLKTKPSDLTMLTKNNHGHFPFTRVFQVIEGSPRVGIHGTREMPIWGDRYRKEAEKYDADAYVYSRGLILELLVYIMTIQEE